MTLPEPEGPTQAIIDALPELLREAFLHGEIGIWNILLWGADEIERLRSICDGTVWEENERLQSQLAETRMITMEELADHFEGSDMGDPWTGKQIAEHIRDRMTL